ncbi:sugar transporter [Apiospora arundinis]
MQRQFSASLSAAAPASSTRRPSHTTGIELPDRTSVSTGHTQYHAQLNRRRHNNQAVIVNPLSHLTDEELVADVYRFQGHYLPSVQPEDLLRAARVAKDVRTYDEVARSEDPTAGSGLPVTLEPNEKDALKAEKDVLFSERGMFIVILTVSLAAFLQGFVQSSINGASLYANHFFESGNPKSPEGSNHPNSTAEIWQLGAANASPFLFAAVVGCFASLPINDLFGRRGAMAVAAVLIFGSSLGSAWCRSWGLLFGVRAINGIGMGIKAVSTPILASETAVGFWRGSSILAWQLWVSFGIFMGFVFNLIFNSAITSGDENRANKDEDLILSLILGSPCVPALFLLAGLWFCPESPRYYMRRKSSRFSPMKAYEMLRRIRTTELQALRDMYLIYKSVQLEEYSQVIDMENQGEPMRRGLLSSLRGYLVEYRDLFVVRRLRNALISSSTVNLAQQLCGINMLAFYSGTLFTGADTDHSSTTTRNAMLYSLGYGAVNFLFGLPAIRTIDTLGRRKWLILTLPLMCITMLGAALSASLIDNHDVRIGIMAFFLYLFSAAYSPGLGPIPFTLASESFPLSHREAGCASAIAVNLLFAGFLTLFFPSITNSLKNVGALGLFAGLNLLAFGLVFLLVEETKRRSLEDLDLVFAVRKTTFIKHQLTRYLPWWFEYYIRRNKTAEQPSLYLDLIWGPRESLNEPHPELFDANHDIPGHVEIGGQSMVPEEGRNSTDTDHK